MSEHIENPNTQTNGKFCPWIEALRIFSIFWVIYNHTRGNGFLLFRNYTPGSVQFFLCLFVSTFCKAAVPVFLAISGALMLGKAPERLGDLWKRRILRMAMILVLFSLIYFIRFSSENINEVDLRPFPKALYSAPTNAFLWYLYLYISFLISLPFLQTLAPKLETKYYLYLIVLALVFNDIRPILELFLWRGAITLECDLIPVWLVGYIPLYALIGYFLYKRVDISKFRAWQMTLLWICDFVVLSIAVFAHYYRDFLLLDGSQLSQSFISSFSIINAITWVITARFIFYRIRIPKILEKFIIVLGRNVFIVYLIHVLVMNMPYFRDIPFCLKSIHPLFAGLIEVLCVMITCFMIAFLYRFFQGIICKTVRQLLKKSRKCNISN